VVSSYWTGVIEGIAACLCVLLLARCCSWLRKRIQEPLAQSHCTEPDLPEHEHCEPPRPWPRPETQEQISPTVTSQESAQRMAKIVAEMPPLTDQQKRNFALELDWLPRSKVTDPGLWTAKKEQRLRELRAMKERGMF
jgi:hypothetical protein